MSFVAFVLITACLQTETVSSPSDTNSSVDMSIVDFSPLGRDYPCPAENLSIVTWNLEWFPKRGRVTLEYVAEVISQLEIDVLAIQELDDRREFDRLLERLPEYSGYYQSEWFAGLAYLYRNDVVAINDIHEIYTSAPYWNAFPRSPMVMDMDVDGERYLLINNHLKCCGDGLLDRDNEYDEETRRREAVQLLQDHIESELSEERVLLLGDLNDDIVEAEPHNVFQSLLDVPSQYRFADQAIAEGSYTEWSYPYWPSHLDHIMVTAPLFDALGISTVSTIKLDQYIEGGWYEYDNNISDHRPVGLCLATP